MLFASFLPFFLHIFHTSNFREKVLTVLREALDEANISPEQIDAVAYTKVTSFKLIFAGF